MYSINQLNIYIMFSTTEKEVIQSAIDQLSAIPYQNFITRDFSNGRDKCCAIGHLVRLASKNPEDYSHSNCADLAWGREIAKNPIRGLSARFLSPGVSDIHNADYRDLAWVNNGSLEKYSQVSVKERVIACLTDMLATEAVEVVS